MVGRGPHPDNINCNFNFLRWRDRYPALPRFVICFANELLLISLSWRFDSVICYKITNCYDTILKHLCLKYAWHVY